MPKLARCAALLSAAVSLALPAAAAAEVITVDPSIGGTACVGSKCPTIQTAVNKAAASDTISVVAGTYAEAVTVDKAITIRGVNAKDVKVTGKGTSDVFNLSAGAALESLTVQVPSDGGSAVVISGANARLADVVAQRSSPSAANDPVVAVSGDADIVDSFIAQDAGTGTAGVASTGTGGVQVIDTLVVSSKGPALLLTDSEANRVVRSTLASSATGAEGLRLAGSSAGAKRVVIDSSFLIGGPSAAALAVLTSGSTAGDVDVLGRHVTAFGAKGAVLDASSAEAGPLADPVGNITATFNSSIVHGASSTKEYVPSLPLLESPNSVSLTFASSDAPPATGDGTIQMGGASNTDPAKLFAANSLRLRLDAPVVDKGAAPAEGESPTDVEGDPRVVGAASDVGADEVVNKPPVVKFGIANPKARVGQDVGFISGSTDPEQEAGGGIREYRWDFGDGTRLTTDKLAAVHKYEQPGSYQVTLQVVDRQGLPSPVSAAQSVTIAPPGSGPAVVITVPGEGRRVKLTRSGGRAPLPLTVLGSWSDAQGIKSVEIALRLIKKDKVKRKRARRAQTTTCTFYSGARLTRKPCAQPIWVPATIKSTGFTMQTRKGLRLPPGRYEVRARGTDGEGDVSAAPSVAGRSLVRFRIR